MQNIYVMSDIHGNYKAFLKMLDEIELKDNDILYVLGDVIDRGEQGLEILEYIMGAKNIILLMGNHEQSMYESFINRDINFQLCENWFNNGGLPTYKALSNLTKTERSIILNYVNNLDKYKIIELNDTKYLLVHAGLSILPKFTLEEIIKIQGDNLLWIRGIFLKSKIKTDYKIVFGHTPVTMIGDIVGEDYRTKNNMIWINDNKIGIDCGCGYNKKLACLRLNDMNEYYIDIEIKE